MNLKPYELRYSADFTVFEFTSSGIKGDIIKIVAFEQLPGYENEWSLGFGDYDSVTESVDGKVISNNGDISKVIFTVMQCAKIFLSQYPERTITFEGVDEKRNNLYNLTLKKHHKFLADKYQVLGIIDKHEEEFKLDNKYTSFRVKIK